MIIKDEVIEYLSRGLGLMDVIMENYYWECFDFGMTINHQLVTNFTIDLYKVDYFMNGSFIIKIKFNYKPFLISITLLVAHYLFFNLRMNYNYFDQ